MGEHIRIRNASGKWVVRAGGAIVAESSEAKELTEGDMPAVIYFPRGDVGMAFLEASDSATRCPYKGQASYFNISTAAGDIPDAAWSYETPLERLSDIAGHIAFYGDKVTVEQL
ncbi:hypothetical protein roselon_03427 [Roseibacterium elongatum DSM 19469]|uniref:DUF427 domain-containing protein n=1 Tax=Roseicyclus elongatus DSM 19469 TaxID=1294273 RepID=W8ST33_9RHOB|nr:DUF427 domain-containing protein [Roseibacterium elongatum]AHM05685.1 hypothetical protein roselon_03427 [Roseibacterium elongatum DSM 19469]